MPFKVMLSHSTKDQAIAQAISVLLEKCSLNQIEPWFSSDPSQAGISVGQRWFDRVHQELSHSKAVIVLLTPNSVNSSWVQFESGFGAAKAELELVPITIGIADRALIPNPLSHWQIFELDEHMSAISFVKKMLAALKIHYDEELVSLHIGRYLDSTRDFRSFNKEARKDQRIEPSGSELKDYIDQKFFELSTRMPQSIDGPVTYRLEIDIPQEGEEFVIAVDEETLFDTTLNAIYFNISHLVSAYKYLEEWIIIDETLKKPLIIKEIQSLIPSHLVLRPNHLYSVRLLTKPYRAGQAISGMC